MLARKPLSLALAALVSASFLGGVARADGGFPRAHGIYLEPGDPSHLLIRSDYWGLFRSVDGGATWTYGCSELYGGGSKQITRRNLLYLEGGRILVGRFGGLRMTDDFCDWRDNTSLSGHFVQDLTRSGADLYAVTADNVNGTLVSNVWKSTDRGDTWTVSGGAFPTDYIGASIRIAPSDASRVYVGGVFVGSSTAAIAASPDGGATWNVTEFTPQSGVFQVRVRAVHPTRPDVVFVWVDTDNELSPDTLWGSGDGGATWTQVFVSTEDIPGLAISPDGTRILVSGKVDKLQGATVDAALAQGQSAFSQVFDGSVWGLTWTSDALYAGNNNFTARGIPAFTLGRSTDGGSTFEQLMNICQLEFSQCSATSTQEALCHEPYEGPGGFVIDFLQTTRCTDPTSTGGAGGQSTAPAKKDGSCSLEPGASNANDHWSLAALAAAIGAFRRRRARRAPA